MTARPAHLEPGPSDRAGELALARSAAAGDEGAFERIYREHAGRVFALCMRMIGSRTRAAELTQDVFVHVWRQLTKWRGESALSTWIHRLAVNLVLSNARGEQRRLKHEMTATELEASDGSPNAFQGTARSTAPADVVNAVDL